MDEASKIALLTGFGGVLFGGAVTFLSELYWRGREGNRDKRKRFQIVLVSVMDACEDLENNMRLMTSSIVEPNELISSQIRAVANHNSQPIHLEPEIMFAVADKEDENLFSETSLFLKRHRSTVDAIKTFYIEKAAFFQLVSDKNMIVNVSNGTAAKNTDIATIEFGPNDKDLILQLNKIEMLAKDLLVVLRDNSIFGRQIIERLNKSAARKYRKLPPTVKFTVESSIPDWLESW